MKNVLILHCWYGGANKEWYPWLKKELEKKNFQVSLPDIAELRKNTPDLKKIILKLEKENDINLETTMIGHSLGALIAMRLAEKHKYQRMILVVGWDYDDLTEGHKLFWKTKINHALIKKNVKEIYVIHSDNDPYTTAIQAEEMSKRLGAKFILVPNAGHFTKEFGVNTTPEILKIF